MVRHLLFGSHGAAAGFRHAGGGSKGLFVVLRYVFIVAASYLVIFQDQGRPSGPGRRS